MYGVATGPHIPRLNERHLQVNRSGVWYDPASFIARWTWLGSRMACLWRSLGFGAFSTARTFASHILTILVKVCVRKGEAWVPGNPSLWTHKAHSMEFKETAARVHVCVCLHVLSWVYGKTCVCASVSFQLSRRAAWSLCYFVFVVVCLGRYRRMQDGKWACIFKQWMVNKLWVQRVCSSWKNLWRELSKAAQRSSLSRQRQTLTSWLYQNQTNVCRCCVSWVKLGFPVMNY